MKSEELRKQFESESSLSAYTNETRTGFFNSDYVRWLEQKLIKKSTFAINDAFKVVPNPESKNKTCNRYYIVKTKYGLQRAMYLKNKKGIKNWYTSYASKLTCKVIWWIDLNDFSL